MRPNVLYIDDDLALLKLAERRLKQDFKVTAISSYHEFMQHIDALEQYAAVLIDFFIGEHNGYDILKKVIEKSPNTPCIIVTSLQNERIAARALKMGADNYLIKDSSGEYLEFLSDLVKKSIQYSQSNKRMLPLKEAIAKAEREGTLKELFIAAMSHELKTPLQAIMGFSACLEEGIYGELQPNQLEIIQKISTASVHLRSLIDDIMMTIRLRQGQTSYSFSTIDLSEILQSSCLMVSKAYEEKKLNFCIDVPKSLEVEGEACKLRQVFINLLSNAAKFSKEKGNIYLLATKVGERVVVEVRDEGIGISECEKENIFKAFTQVEENLGRRGEGLGLGLYIVKNLVDGHGGEIEVESVPGKGTTFKISLLEKICPE